MSDPLTRLQRFLAELKRRKVYRTAVLYGVVAFGVWQVAEYVFPALGFPAWTLDFVVVLSLLGFPIALVLAWAFQVTPEGVRRTEAGPEEPARGSAYQWIGLALVVLAAGGGWYLTAGPGAKPSQETSAPPDTAERASRSAPDTAGPPRITVLPFENIAPDSSDAFFAEGMHEEVLNQLSKVSGLKVISRTSVMQYAGTGKTVQEISEELGGVSALLEGTVRRAGDQLRITTQLIQAPEDVHLWSNTYDRELSVDAIFDIQADIAQQIAGALATVLTEGERRRIASAPTSDLAAYDAYLRGRSQFWRFRPSMDPNALSRSVEALEEAVRRDSTFAEAFAWLALAYADRSRFQGRTQWLDSASVVVRRAQVLDSTSAVVQAARGYTLMARDSLSTAERSFRRSLDLQPNFTHAIYWLAELHQYTGDWKESVYRCQQLVSLEPRTGRSTGSMGEKLWLIGMLDAAEAWMRRLVAIESERGPAGVLNLLLLTEVYLDQGEVARARTVADSALTLHPEHPEALALAGKVALYAGEISAAGEYLEQVPDARRSMSPGSASDGSRTAALQLEERALLGHSEVRLGNQERGTRLLQSAADSLRTLVDRERALRQSRRALLAGVLAALDQRQEALGQLEQLAARGYPRAEWLSTYPLFSGLRSEPRFQQILGQIEANQQQIQEEVRQMDLDLFPPGMEAGSASRE